MIGKGFTASEKFDAHIETHPLVAHGIWPRIKEYVPAFGYSKAQIDAFFESYSGAGKAQVDYTNVLGLTDGAVPYGTGATGLAGNVNNLYYDISEQLLGVREPAPTARVHITSVGGAVPALNLEAGAEGELVTPDGQQLRIGHWDGVDFTERLRIDDAGKFYISYLPAGAVIFAGANGEVKYDEDNFFWNVGAHRLGLNLAGGAPQETLDMDGKLRLRGTNASLIANYVGAGREILTLRGKSSLADGAGMNLYGNGDATFPGQIKLFTNNITAMTIDFAQLITIKDLSISTPVQIYNLSHNLFADYVAAKHYDWTNETHDFLTTGTLGCGVLTSGNIIIPDAGYIGSVSDPDAIQIEADGDIVMSQDLAITGTLGVAGRSTFSARLTVISSTDAYMRAQAVASTAYARFRAQADTGDNFVEFYQFGSTVAGNDPIGVPRANLGLIYAGLDTSNIVIRTGPSATANILFGTGSPVAERLRIDPSGNIGIAQTTFGADMTKGYAQATGVAPTDSPADCFQMYSADIGGVAGKAGVHFRDEEGNIISLGSGGMLMSGTARIGNDNFVGPTGIKAPGTKPATWVEHGISGVWQFADGDDETIVITYRVPHRMDRSVAPYFHIKWSADGENPGNCEWQLEYLWRSPNEDTTAIAQDTENITVAASATANGLVVSNTPGLDLPSATDNILMVRLKRLAAGGNDTIADTVELHGVNLHFTSNKLGTAI